MLVLDAVGKFGSLSWLPDSNKVSGRVQTNSRGNKTFVFLWPCKELRGHAFLSVSFHWIRVLLAVDQHQQYGFPVSSSQRASVTLTPLHSAPSDSTPRSESCPAECLISQPDRSFFSSPSSAVCPLVAIARSVDAWMNL